MPGMSSGRPAATAGSSGDGIPRDAWLRLAACAGAAALLQMDGTIVTVALPSVGEELDADSHSLSYVLMAYFLAYAITLFPGGHLVDRVGSRRVALAGLAAFAAGALLGALSGSFGVLIASRVVQGIGAGLVSPASLAGAVSGFPPERRGAALGIWGASSGAANLIGPVVGGLLTVAIDWRACFWFLIPASGAAALAMWRLVPRDVRVDAAPDTAGLRQRVVAAAALVAALTFAVMIGSFYIGQQYLQSASGYSALGAAAALTLIALLVTVGAPVAGRLVRHARREHDGRARLRPGGARPRGAGDSRRAARRPRRAAAAGAVRPRARNAVRAGLARCAERGAAGQARAGVVAAVDGAPGGRRFWSRAGRHGAVRRRHRGPHAHRARERRRTLRGDRLARRRRVDRTSTRHL